MARLLFVLIVSLTCLACRSQSKEEPATAPSDAVVERYLRSQGQADSQTGMRTMPSGLKYEVLTEGTGRSPGYNDVVVVNYRGWNEAGEVFDDSYRRGQPAVFPVGGVIEGWQQALRAMKEGARWRVVIPPYLAYGEKGNPPLIKPGETLTFEMELLQVR